MSIHSRLSTRNKSLAALIEWLKILAHFIDILLLSERDDCVPGKRGPRGSHSAGDKARVLSRTPCVRRAAQ